MKIKTGYKITLLVVGLILFVIWVEFEQRFVVKGRVVDSSTGSPIEGASVAIKWSGTHFIEAFIPYASGSYTIESARTTTGKDGYFEIPKYFLKDFYMGVYKKGYVCWSNDHIFIKGPSASREKFFKNRIFFWLRNGTAIKLEPFSEDDSRPLHGYYVDITSRYTGGLEGIGDEIKIFWKYYQPWLYEKYYGNNKK